MNNEMIERVARAIYDVSPFSAAPSDNPANRAFLRWDDLATHHREQFRDEARAAIAAMRGSTEEMLAAGVAAWLEESTPELNNEAVIVKIYRAVIGEALK